MPNIAPVCGYGTRTGAIFVPNNFCQLVEDTVALQRGNSRSLSLPNPQSETCTFPAKFGNVEGLQTLEFSNCQCQNSKLAC